MELLFRDLLIILGIAIAVLLIGYRFRLPPIVGFLLTGVLVGPHGFALIGKINDVEMLAEIGIILLLFGIGMEFSIKKLMRIKRLFLLGGSLQVGLTIILTFIIVWIGTTSWREGLFVGYLLCMSSTAIVLGLLEQNGESSSPHGRIAIAILIFQDMIAIPMLLLMPLLGEQAEESTSMLSLLLSLLKGIIIIALAFISAQRFVPRLLLLVARTRNKELFLLTMITLCFGVAWLTANLGLSLTIGAFLAGLIISESEYSNEAISNIFPFQALFISFFFISIGMLLDINFVIQHPFKIICFAGIALAIKMCSGCVTTYILGLPMRTILLVGVSLSQIGEFAFVLASSGLSYGLISDQEYQLFLAVALLTMGSSPILINFAPRIAAWCGDFNFFKQLNISYSATSSESSEEKKPLDGHVIIIGFGISGRNLARSCKHAGIPYTILEMNPDTVHEQKLQGEPIQFGDATNLSILEHVNIACAKALAVLVNDPLAARRIVKLARQVNTNVYIIVRARYVQEMALISKLGADEAIPDEFGTSIEIFSRVLRQYHVPDEDILALISDIRADGYELLRNREKVSTKLSEIKLNLDNVEVSSFRIHSSSTLVGKMLIESNLRRDHGMTVLLIKRGDKILSNPSPDAILMANDILIVVGASVSMKHSTELFGSIEQLAPAT